MLNNASDYTEGATSAPHAQLYGSLNPNRHKAVRNAAGIKSESHPAAPKPVEKGRVPSVIGLGLREAVVALEDKGYNVKFRGSGYVTRQNPVQGTPLKEGEAVTLALVP